MELGDSGLSGISQALFSLYVETKKLDFREAKLRAVVTGWEWGKGGDDFRELGSKVQFGRGNEFSSTAQLGEYNLQFIIHFYKELEKFDGFQQRHN